MSASQDKVAKDNRLAKRKERQDNRQVTIETLFKRLLIWLGIGVGAYETEEQAAVRKILQNKSLSKEERIRQAEELSLEYTTQLLHQIYEEDLEEKLEYLGHPDNEARLLQDAKEAAEEWWITAEDTPQEVLNTTGTQEAVRQFALDKQSEHSVELFQQLYFDAAKAQLRLKQIAGTVNDDLPGSISGISVSMPEIKGTVRATYKSWLPDHVRYMEIEKIPDADRTAAQREEFKVLSVTLYGDNGDVESQHFTAGLRDLSRGTVEVLKLTEIVPSVLHFFNKIKQGCPGAEVTRFKNKFVGMYEGSDTSGYADVQIHFRIDGGHICEMQFNCKALMDFKSFGGSRRNLTTDAGNPAGNWGTLIGNYLGASELHYLTDAADALEELIIKDMINGEAPEKAVEAINTIKAGKTNGGLWPLNAHLIYDITRWLEKAPVKAPAHNRIKDNVISKLKLLSLKGSEAFQNSVAQTEGSGSQTFRDLLKSVAEFKLDLGPAGTTSVQSLKEPT
jgi:hypothetical protein